MYESLKTVIIWNSLHNGEHKFTKASLEINITGRIHYGAYSKALLLCTLRQRGAIFISFTP